MKEQLVKISETIYLIFLPADVHNFNVQAEHLIYREGKLKLWKYFKIGFDFKIHGTCTLPAFDFDFEVDEIWVKNTEEKLTWKKFYNYNTKMYSLNTKEQSFRTRIQKAIQDEGMFIVNPIEKPLSIYYTPEYGCQKYPQECYTEDLKKWQSAESKIVKGKILIIEKL